MAFATIGTKGIEDAAIATADIADNAVTSAKTSGIPARPNVQPLIINGNMAVAQRGTSATGKTGSGYYTCDRWNMSASSLGTWTQTQDSDVPTGYGFANSLKMDCTTADASPAAGDNLALQYSFEGQDLQLLRKGTSNAQKTTISFWVKSVKTGTYICEVYDHDNSRTISTAYTISSGSTWEQKIINVPGDTSGALDDNNAQSLSIQFHLAAGSNYTSGTLNTSWNANVNANRMVGQVNLGDSTSNNFWITGVQMEVGEYTSSTLPPFQHESYGNNLARCQRYYYKLAAGTNQVIGLGNGYASTALQVVMEFPTSMRADVSLDVVAGTDWYIGYGENGNDTFNSFNFATQSTSHDKVMCDAASTWSGTQGSTYFVRTADSQAYLAFSAEL